MHHNGFCKSALVCATLSIMRAALGCSLLCLAPAAVQPFTVAPSAGAILPAFSRSTSPQQRTVPTVRKLSSALAAQRDSDADDDSKPSQTQMLPEIAALTLSAALLLAAAMPGAVSATAVAMPQSTATGVPAAKVGAKQWTYGENAFSGALRQQTAPKPAATAAVAAEPAQISLKQQAVVQPETVQVQPSAASTAAAAALEQSKRELQYTDLTQQQPPVAAAVDVLDDLTALELPHISLETVSFLLLSVSTAALLSRGRNSNSSSSSSSGGGGEVSIFFRDDPVQQFVPSTSSSSGSAGGNSAFMNFSSSSSSSGQQSAAGPVQQQRDFAATIEALQRQRRREHAAAHIGSSSSSSSSSTVQKKPSSRSARHSSSGSSSTSASNSGSSVKSSSSPNTAALPLAAAAAATAGTATSAGASRSGAHSSKSTLFPQRQPEFEQGLADVAAESDGVLRGFVKPPDGVSHSATQKPLPDTVVVQRPPAAVDDAPRHETLQPATAAAVAPAAAAAQKPAVPLQQQALQKPLQESVGWWGAVKAGVLGGNSSSTSTRSSSSSSSSSKRSCSSGSSGKGGQKVGDDAMALMAMVSHF
jgi:hypothetical protein